MFSPEFRELLGNTTRSMRTIWAAVVASTLLLVVVAHAVGGPPVSAMPESLRVVLTAGAVAAGWASLAVRRRYLSAADAGARQVSERFGSPLVTERVSRLPELERRVMQAVLQTQVPFVVCLALNEGVAALGVVRTLAGGDSGDALPFVLASLALTALMFPRPGRSAERLWLEAHRT